MDRQLERPQGYLGKTLRGAAVFTPAWVVGFAAGLIAEFLGGGWG